MKFLFQLLLASTFCLSANALQTMEARKKEATKLASFVEAKLYKNNLDVRKWYMSDYAGKNKSKTGKKISSYFSQIKLQKEVYIHRVGQTIWFMGKKDTSRSSLTFLSVNPIVLAIDGRVHKLSADQGMNSLISLNEVMEDSQYKAQLLFQTLISQADAAKNQTSASAAAKATATTVSQMEMYAEFLAEQDYALSKDAQKVESEGEKLFNQTFYYQNLGTLRSFKCEGGKSKVTQETTLSHYDNDKKIKSEFETEEVRPGRYKIKAKVNDTKINYEGAGDLGDMYETALRDQASALYTPGLQAEKDSSDALAKRCIPILESKRASLCVDYNKIVAKSAQEFPADPKEKKLIEDEAATAMTNNEMYKGLYKNYLKAYDDNHYAITAYFVPPISEDDFYKNFKSGCRKYEESEPLAIEMCHKYMNMVNKKSKKFVNSYMPGQYLCASYNKECVNTADVAQKVIERLSVLKMSSEVNKVGDELMKKINKIVLSDCGADPEGNTFYTDASVVCSDEKFTTDHFYYRNDYEYIQINVIDATNISDMINLAVCCNNKECSSLANSWWASTGKKRYDVGEPKLLNIETGVK